MTILYSITEECSGAVITAPAICIVAKANDHPPNNLLLDLKVPLLKAPMSNQITMI